MKRVARLFVGRERRDILRDEGGLAAVEFALASTAIFAMISAAVDLTQLITTHRDLGRLTAEIAQVLVACPDDTCLNQTILAINSRKVNIAPKLSTIQLGMAYFKEKNNAIDGNTIGGTMTFLPADISAAALAMLNDGDQGVAVLATYTHTPIILGLADDWGFTTKNFRAFAVNLRRRP